MKRIFPIILLSCLLTIGCSTVRTLSPGQYRLAKNEVKVNDKHFRASELTPYIKQQSNTYFIFGWNPFLNIYNWSDGSDSAFSRFCRKIGTAPVVYNPELVKSSEENITNHLRYLGYYNARVSADEKSRGRLMRVVYNIDLGSRLPILDIRYKVPEDDGFADSFFADTSGVLVKRGSLLSEARLEEESARSSEHMRNDGYFGFSKSNYFFEADTITTPGAAILDYHIRNYTRGADPGKAAPFHKYRFGDVTISYDNDLVLNEKVLKRLNAIVPGSVYREKDANTTYSRFSSIQLFSGVNIKTTPTDSNLVNCDIHLTPAKLKGFKINLEGSITSTGLVSISPQLNFYHKNLFHGGEWFNIGFQGAFQFKPKDNLRANEFGVNASISFPRPLLIPAPAHKTPTITRTEIKASYNFQSRPEYTRHIMSASYGYNGRLSNKFLFQLYPIQMSFVRLTDISDGFKETLEKNPYLTYSYSDHFDAGAGGTLYLTTNNDIVPKTSYRYLRFNFDASGNILSLFKGLMPRGENGSAQIFNVPFSQYLRGELNLCNVWRFGKWNGQALAARLSLGVGGAYGNSYSLPYEKQFYVGGASSMRGWQARSVGPGFSKPITYTLLPSQTGDVKIEADLEYRARLFWKLEAALFAELGNVWTLPKVNDLAAVNPDDLQSVFDFTTFYRSLAADWGVGLRLNLDFIILRFDFGMKIHDPARDEGQRWLGPDKWFKSDGCAFHFGVGYPF